MHEFTIVRAADAAAFLAATLPLRLADPVNTNVLGSIAESAVDGSRRYEAEYWWLVEHHGAVAGAAVHTPHYRPVLSPMPEAAAPLLADAMLAQCPGIRGVTGPEAPALAFARRVALRTGHDATENTLRELIYVLGSHTPRAGVAGRARAATPEDVPLLIDWFTQFGLEALGSIHTVTEEDVLRRLEHRDMLLWLVDEAPVAMAGHAALTPSPTGLIGRIGPVFTAKEQRGHGFGAAITSAMIEHLQGLQCASILLYTDAAYEQSNKVYRALGFAPVGSVVELGGVTGLDAPGPPST